MKKLSIFLSFLVMVVIDSKAISYIEQWSKNYERVDVFCDALRTDNVIAVQEAWEQEICWMDMGLSDTHRIRIALAQMKCKNPLVLSQFKRWGFVEEPSVFLNRMLHSGRCEMVKHYTSENEHEERMVKALRSDDIRELRAAWETLPESYKTYLSTDDIGLLWIEAVRCKNPLMLSQLKKWGFDPYAFSASGKNSLMAVALIKDEVGDYRRDYYVREKCICVLIQRHGISVNDQNPEGKTALMYAAQTGNSTAVCLLAFGKKADKKIKDLSGRTALDYLEEYASTATTDREKEEVGRCRIFLKVDN